MKHLFKIELDQERIFGLDILRASAILFVVIGHGGYLLPDRFQKANNFFVFDGVSIFFVLSGFLIGGILIKILNKDEINGQTIVNFWIRRWFRTLPNYFLILVILCILNYLFTDDFKLSGVKRYFIFSQNLIKGHPAFFPEAWSLSIEEWFYLLIPVLIWIFILVLKTPPRWGVLLTVIFVLFSVTIFRYYRYKFSLIDNMNTNAYNLLFRKPVITRLDSLMFGVAGAYVQYYHNKMWLQYKNTLLLTGIILLLLSKFIIPAYARIDSMYFTVFSFSVTSLATFFLLPFLSVLKTGKGIVFKSITYISLTSYSMYLLNLSIIQVWIINRIPWAVIIDNNKLLILTRYTIYWFMVILLSILLYKYFEVPMTRLRENRTIKKLMFSYK